MTPNTRAGEAVPKISRRLFLTRSAAASAIGLPVAAGVAEAKSDTVSENPELLRACDVFDKAFAEYEVALLSKNAAVRAYNALVPEVPEELIAESRHRGIADDERDVEGNCVYPLGRPQRKIITVRLCERYGDLPSLASKAEIARRYEAACEAARNETGVDARLEAVYWAADAVRRQGEIVGKLPATSSLGVIRKATAAHSLASIRDCSHRAVYLFGQDFWAEIIAVLGYLENSEAAQ